MKGVVASCSQLSAYHTVVVLHRNNPFCPLEQFHCQVTSSRTNFQNNISAFDASLVYNGLHNQRIFKDMLAFALVEFNACIQAQMKVCPA